MLDFGILGLNARNILYIKKLNDAKSIRLADDKYDTKRFLSERGIPVGETYAMIRSKRELADFRFGTLPDRDFVVKPNRGSKGNGIMIVRRTPDGGFVVSGETLDEEALRRRMLDILDGAFSLSGGADSALVEERLVPHGAFAPFCEYGLADIRMIVYNLVPIASMVRVPTERSDGKANLAQGGIGMGIDIATGHIASMFRDRQSFVRSFPAGYERFSRMSVPYWDDILLQSSRAQFFINLGYLALDWVITPDGPRLLEANARAGLEVQNVTLVPLKTRLNKVANLRIHDPEKGVEIAQSLFGQQKLAHFVRESDILYLSQPGVLTAKGAGEPVTRLVDVRVDPSTEGDEASPDIVAALGGREAGLELDDTATRFERLRLAPRADAPAGRVFLGRASVGAFFIKPETRAPSKGRVAFGIPVTEWSGILRLDREMRELQKKLNFSRLLRPANQTEELDRFVGASGRYDPVFAYDFPDRDAVEHVRIGIAELRKRDLGGSFRAGIVPLYAEKLDELDVKCDLLDAYREAHYDRVAELDARLYGGSDPVLLDLAKRRVFGAGARESGREALGAVLGADAVERLLRENLDRIGFGHVAVQWSDTSLARVSVSFGTPPKITLSRHAEIREKELMAIFGHEVETHLRRSANAQQYGLELIKRGTGFYLATEEGLAICKSFEYLPPGYEKNAMYEQYLLAHEAGERSFAQLVDAVRSIDPAKTLARAFGIALRLKAGVTRTQIRARGAMHGKNRVYLAGYDRVRRWIDAGNDPAPLFAGKIKIEDLPYLATDV